MTRITFVTYRCMHAVSYLLSSSVILWPGSTQVFIIMELENVTPSEIIFKEEHLNYIPLNTPSSFLPPSEIKHALRKWYVGAQRSLGETCNSCSLTSTTAEAPRILRAQDREVDIHILESKAYRRLKQRGLCDLGTVPHFFGTLPKFDPGQCLP